MIIAQKSDAGLWVRRHGVIGRTKCILVQEQPHHPYSWALLSRAKVSGLSCEEVSPVSLEEERGSIDLLHDLEPVRLEVAEDAPQYMRQVFPAQARIGKQLEVDRSGTHVVDADQRLGVLALAAVMMRNRGTRKIPAGPAERRHPRLHVPIIRQERRPRSEPLVEPSGLFQRPVADRHIGALD